MMASRALRYWSLNVSAVELVLLVPYVMTMRRGCIMETALATYTGLDEPLKYMHGVLVTCWMPIPTALRLFCHVVRP